MNKCVAKTSIGINCTLQATRTIEGYELCYLHVATWNEYVEHGDEQSAIRRITKGETFAKQRTENGTV